MKVELDILSCTACHACVAVCPKECISMKSDDLGFLRPCVDHTKCIECGLCLKTCDSAKQVPACPDRAVYAAKNKDLQIRKSSSSGGVFSALSDAVLQDGGIVVGARYDEDMSVKHDFAENSQQRDFLRGSKYTYSLCDERIFKQVERYLKDGRTVMFTGTPCQAAALRAYLRKPYDRLLVVDILCHGISAPVLYQDFIKGLKKKNASIKNIDFRYDRNGNWHEPKTRVTYDNGTSACGEYENSYFRMFVRNCCLRECCYICNFARFDRVSDITLGDFWGIENAHPSFDEPYGVSVVVVNNEKGRRLFESVRHQMDVLECSERDCSHDQLNGLKPGGRDLEFVDDYRTHGYEYVRKKYVTTPFAIRIREKLYQVKWIRRMRDAVKGS